MSSSNSLIIWPWKHDSELAMIRDWFYPEHAQIDLYSVATAADDGNSKRKDLRWEAVQRVGIWTYLTPDTPHAVSATAALMDARLHDENLYRPTPPVVIPRQLLEPDDISTTPSSYDGARPQLFKVSEQAMKSIYAMSFCRFVNGFVDRDVAKSGKGSSSSSILGLGLGTDMAGEDDGEESATDVPSSKMPGMGPSIGAGESSMYAHATRIGMPSSFVDMRHRATHGKDLPNINELRIMNSAALTWLWNRWWKVHAKGNPARAIYEEETDGENWNKFVKKQQLLKEQLATREDRALSTVTMEVSDPEPSAG